MFLFVNQVRLERPAGHQTLQCPHSWPRSTVRFPSWIVQSGLDRFTNPTIVGDQYKNCGHANRDRFQAIDHWVTEWFRMYYSLWLKRKSSLDKWKQNETSESYIINNNINYNYNLNCTECVNVEKAQTWLHYHEGFLRPVGGRSSLESLW